MVFQWWWEFKCFIQHQTRWDADEFRYDSRTHTFSFLIIIDPISTFSLPLSLSGWGELLAYLLFPNFDTVALCIRCTLLHFFDYTFYPYFNSFEKMFQEYDCFINLLHKSTVFQISLPLHAWCCCRCVISFYLCVKSIDCWFYVLCFMKIIALHRIWWNFTFISAIIGEHNMKLKRNL